MRYGTKKVPAPSASQTKRVPNQRSADDTKWRFSFLYWKQIDNFGLDCNGVSKTWFVSLLDRLRELSSKTIEQVTIREKDSWRFHAINWNQKNIPISKSSLSWIPTDVIHSEEVEFYQFQVSQALGRIIGFFGAENIFYIVLLDPMHNAQPSKSFGYKVNKTRILYTPYQSLLHDLVSVKNKIEKHCSPESCQVLSLSQNIGQPKDSGNHLLIDDAFSDAIQELMQSYDYEDFFWLLFDAIEALKVQKSSEK